MDKQIVVYPEKGIQLSIKRNELLIHATIWMNFKIIMLSERSQTKMRVCVCVYMIPFISNSRRLIYSDSKSVVAWG